MHKLQRSAGKLLKRTVEDAEVGTLLKQFDEADVQLKIVSYSRSLILKAHAYHQIYSSS